MSNKTLFAPSKYPNVVAADTVNEAGGRAYEMTAYHGLAQLAVTGCFGNTYYADASSQLDKVIQLASKVDPEFLAKTAVYSREHGKMKDMPAVLMVLLSKADPVLFRKVFPRVIDSGKMIRNFVQVVLSGKCGRRCLGSGPKRAIREWFLNTPNENIFRQSIGSNPTVSGVLRLAHVKPANAEQDALFKYLLGYDSSIYDYSSLPNLIKQIEHFRKNPETNPVPPVSFEWLGSLPLTKKHWRDIAVNATWLQTVKNLNTFQRHGVFDDAELTQQVAARIANHEEVARTKAFPYQLMVAYANATTVPAVVREALQDAMEFSTQNVPVFSGTTYVCVDVSGSMSSPVTGSRGSATSVVRCVDVAGLFASVVLRNNKLSRVIPFEYCVVEGRIQLNPRDSVMTNAQKLASICGGGTNCAAPLALLNNESARGDAVVFISDNQSWVDSSPNFGYNNSTGLMVEWQRFKNRNQKAKLITLDLQPYPNAQVKEHLDILQVGGFSETVFDVMKSFLEGSWGNNHWIEVINRVEL
jgi:60 kDa SS-A/Ro ribonucleoprotein